MRIMTGEAEKLRILWRFATPIHLRTHAPQDQTVNG